jgi:hypothetical protein
MKVDNREIYQQFGNLIYAIVADQHLKPLEMAELKLLISKDGLRRKGNNSEAVVSEETHFIVTTIDALQASNVSPTYAFDEFKKFYLGHPEVFTSDVKQRILDKANQIARIFKADNPSENEHLKLLVDVLSQSAIGNVSTVVKP